MFELDWIVILSVIELFRLIDVCVRLHDLIDPLLDNPHVRHHVDLRDALCPKQLGILLAVEQVEYLLHARHDGLHTALPVVEVECEPLGLALQLPQAHLHLLDVSSPLYVLVAQVRRVPQSLDLPRDALDLVLQTLDVLRLVVDELEQTEVPLLRLDELSHQHVRVFDTRRLFDL